MELSWDDIMAKLNSEIRPYFLEPLPVTTGISPIRAPSPCEDCPGGIKRSGSCHDCLNQTSPHPPTPVAKEDIEIECRKLVGDDAVDTLLNPVGMVLANGLTAEEQEEAIRRLEEVGREVQERDEWHERRIDALREEQELLANLWEDMHCPGCGRAGYDEFCSRDCLREQSDL